MKRPGACQNTTGAYKYSDNISQLKKQGKIFTSLVYYFQQEGRFFRLISAGGTFLPVDFSGKERPLSRFRNPEGCAP